MTSSTKLVVFAAVVSSLLVLADSYTDDWEDDWVGLNDIKDPRQTLISLLYRKRGELQGKYLRKYMTIGFKEHS